MSTGGHRPTYRTLREQHSFAYCVDRLGIDVKQLDDLLGHLRWRLSREPERYSFQLPNRKTRVAFTEELRGVPVLRVFFWVESEDLVVLAWIERVDEAPPLGFDDWLNAS